MNIIRVKRIASSLQREISDIIANDIRDEDIRMVTVTNLKLANDLGYAKVYITTLFDDRKDKILLDLNNAGGFIKSELCKRKFEIRSIPTLEFLYDDSIDYANNIEKIIKKLNEEKQ